MKETQRLHLDPPGYCGVCAFLLATVLIPRYDTTPVHNAQLRRGRLSISLLNLHSTQTFAPRTWKGAVRATPSSPMPKDCDEHARSFDGVRAIARSCAIEEPTRGTLQV